MIIIDGSNGALDFQITLDPTGTPIIANIKCFTNYWSADFVRDFTEQTTFCTSGWRQRQPGLKQLVGMADGYLAKEAVGTNPMLYIESSAPAEFMITMDTDCSYDFDGHVGRVHTGIRAAMNSEFSLNFESYGQVTTLWVVAPPP